MPRGSRGLPGASRVSCHPPVFRRLDSTSKGSKGFDLSSMEAGSSGVSGFDSAWWLPGPHGQTIWGRMTRGRRLVEFHREILETPDGDELVLDHLDGPEESPRVLLLHGLEGSSY